MRRGGTSSAHWAESATAMLDIVTVEAVSYMIMEGHADKNTFTTWLFIQTWGRSIPAVLCCALHSRAQHLRRWSQHWWWARQLLGGQGYWLCSPLKEPGWQPSQSTLGRGHNQPLLPN